ncbi:flagellar hook-basal body complex protein [Polynucleobacter sp. AP-Ainpum-60-G11]|uniref:flagellar hook-basal body complex protein n=2 Tax=unclassified Polynucleobacter TaxID=2640945 RepID=UPI001BFD781A|nr:flagellar hook-basal body complex protein [Polynucleobacter sp. AP-Ainpum-60-G11]QWE27170.1 flagellar hook-basal body complex protein [Polynucleobacter sp. AP-Ainpum-60-G11]
MGYGIGLSGLKSASEAIDVTSNNISNAQTVGYKSGEYVFSDQFFRAQDPQSVDRAGMGAYRMAIRRTGSYGTVVNSQNPLDMAITGPGMFMMAKTVDGTVPTENPTKFQYSRNGQFAVDNQNRIVNENGMYLVGYPADSSGTIISSAKSVLILDRTPLAQQPTRNSNLELNLDNRVDPKTGNVFSPTDPTTYSQATSQTIYDDKGFAHTLSMFYKKVSSQDLTISADEVGTAAGSTFNFSPTQTIDPDIASVDSYNRPPGEQFNKISSTAVALGTGAASTESIYEATLTPMSGAANTVGTVYNLRLRDGTNLTLTQTVAGTSLVKAEYTVNVDRFEVFATVDGNPVTPDASITTPTPPSRTAGAAAVTESNSVVFPALTTGETFTMAGLTFTSGTGTTSAQLAAAFASITPGEGFATVNSNNSLTTPLTVGAFTAGTVAGWSSGARTGSTVVFTSSTAYTSVSDLVSTGTRATLPTITTTEGVAASASMVFNALAAGQKLTMAGLTFTAGTSGATAAQVAAAFASITAGQAYTTVNTNNSLTGASTGGVFTSGAAAEWSTGTATAATVVFTCTAGKSGVTGLTSVLDPVVGGIADASVLIEGSPVAEQQSLGVMGFIAGKNIDSLSKDSFGNPQFATRFNIDASRGEGSEYGQTLNGGGIQLTIEANGSTGYSSAAQTYTNTQDGSATSQLASYNVDSSGRLVAQYDNGSSVVKGQLILAYFNNLEGLIPNGNNTYEASSASGEPLLSFPGDGTLGAIRSKAVEQSNVDLTEELVKLMVLQRQYSAVSQATKVMAATLIDDAINIGR